MRRYAVIGSPISQSFSPGYFNKKFKDLGISDIHYAALEVKDIAEIRNVIEEHGLDGFNVTIPHKETIIEHLDELSHDARSIGAVNTVKIVDGKLLGFNTDHIGFRESLVPILEGRKRALIFGTGGSSLAVMYALETLGVEYNRVSRGELGNLQYHDIMPELLADYPILINTTPLGMHPLESKCIPIDYQGIAEGSLCIDLIYNPEETVFLRNCKNAGAEVKNGLEMLEIQADKSWEIWNS